VWATVPPKISGMLNPESLLTQSAKNSQRTERTCQMIVKKTPVVKTAGEELCESCLEEGDLLH